MYDDRAYHYDVVLLKFTGKERDPESGLDYLGARYYGSNMGRFLSPDEFTGGPVDSFSAADPSSPGPLPYADITNPQSLNKYSYTYNNPLRYTDPNGHCVDACIVEGAIAIGTGVIFTAAVIQYYRQNPDAGAALAAGANAASQAFSRAIGSATSFFAKDAEWGRIDKAAQDATGAAADTIGKAKAERDQYVNPGKVDKHIAAQEQGIQRINDLRKDYDKAKGKGEKDRIKEKLREETDRIKGHDKEIKKMPRKGPETK